MAKSWRSADSLFEEQDRIMEALQSGHRLEPCPEGCGCASCRELRNPRKSYRRRPRLPVRKPD